MPKKGLNEKERSQDKEIVIPPAKAGRWALGRYSRLWNKKFGMFVLVFVAIASFFAFRAFATNITTEDVAAGTTPGGFHQACIDPNGGSHEFWHVDYCTGAEKADGAINSGNWKWCADLDLPNPVGGHPENNWLYDGVCSTDGSVTVTLSATPNIIYTDQQPPPPSSYLQWQVTGQVDHCEKVMAPNSPNSDPYWNGNVKSVSQGYATVQPTQLGLYIYVIRCFDSGGTNVGHSSTTVELKQGSTGGGACGTVPTVYGDQGTHHVPAPVTTDTTATIYSFINPNSPPNQSSCKTYYYFAWGGNPPTNVIPDTPAVVSPEDNQQHTVNNTITGLTANTKYYYMPCSYIKDSKGNSGPTLCSSLQSFTTTTGGGGGGCGFNDNSGPLIKLAVCQGYQTFYDHYCPSDTKYPVPTDGSQTAQNLLCNYYGSKSNPKSFTDSDGNTEVYNQGNDTFTCNDNPSDCKDIFDSLRGPAASNSKMKSGDCQVAKLSNNLLNAFVFLAKNYFGTPTDPNNSTTGPVGTYGLCRSVPGTLTPGHQQGLAADMVRVHGFNLLAGSDSDGCNTKHWARRAMHYLSGTLSIGGNTIPSNLVPNYMVGDGIRGYKDSDDTFKGTKCDFPDASNPMSTYNLGGPYSNSVLSNYRGRVMIDYSNTNPFPPPPPSQGSGSVFMVGDSLTVGMDQSGSVRSKFSAAGHPVSRIEATVGISTSSSVSTIKSSSADQAAVAASGIAVVELGTNPGSNTTASPSSFVPDIQSMVSTLKNYNPNIKIYWMNAYADDDHSDYTGINQALAGQASSQGYQVIDWHSEAINNNSKYAPFAGVPGPPKVHPSQHYDNLATFVVNSTVGGGGGGGGNCSVKGGINANEPIVWNYLCSKGATKIADAAFMGNMQQESTFLPNADNGSCHGIVQWCGGRLSALKNYCPVLNSLSCQLDFMWNKELGPNGSYRSVYNAVQSDSSLNDATAIVFNQYEGPGDGTLGKRQGYAATILALYGSQN